MNKKASFFNVALFLLVMTLNISYGEKLQKMDYFFEVSNDESLLAGTSKILNIVEIGPNMSEDAAKVKVQAGD